MSQKRQNRCKPKIALSAPGHILRFSPKIVRIHATSKSDKNSEEANSKTALIISPQPHKRHSSRSPFIVCPNVLPHYKILPIQKNSTHRIPPRAKNRSKNMSTTEATITNISCTSLPPPQDFKLLLSQLLDFFSSPEDLTEYFFLGRTDPIEYYDFFDSCFTLGITELFSDLSKIFHEAFQNNSLYKNAFILKAIEVQNAGILSKKKKLKASEPEKVLKIVKKIVSGTSDNQSEKTKKVIRIIKHSRSPSELLMKLQNEFNCTEITDEELIILMEYSKAQKIKRRKADLNMTAKLMDSPYTLVPCSVGNRKHTLSCSKTPPRRRGKS
ncbi:hypothetical protein SteCoe_22423 [Stentor coeruleus]|uniref:Uncharacterized protein n=1 Tax=Stentor coeruleus TaxID=5963 RepID=A0A1R2BMB7_9CILI|nr:hypothetical protein SteCoe_22423 [Stentor coeruleus]